MYIYIYIICCPTLRRMATTAWSISWFGLQIGQRRCSAQPWRLGGLGASSGFHQIYGDSMLTWVMIKGYTPRVTSDIETIEEPKPLDLSWRFLVPVSFAYVYKYLYIYIYMYSKIHAPAFTSPNDVQNNALRMGRIAIAQCLIPGVSHV